MAFQLEDINFKTVADPKGFIEEGDQAYKDRVAKAADKIISNRDKSPIVLLSGPSGSGKTTTAMRLQEYLQNLGVKVCLLSMDNFFLPLDKRPPEATDWESPYCVDVDTLLTCISQLLDGMEADIPWYDFKNGTTGGYLSLIQI